MRHPPQRLSILSLKEEGFRRTVLSGASGMFRGYNRGLLAEVTHDTDLLTGFDR
jgi:hypothetical protein